MSAIVCFYMVSVDLNTSLFMYIQYVQYSQRVAVSDTSTRKIF